MTSDQKQTLESRLWAIADTLRGRMNADEYKNYMLGFIFYKFLSERIEKHANKLLKQDNLSFHDISDKPDYIKAVKQECINDIGYFLGPKQLFNHLVKRFKGEVKGESTFILEDLNGILNSIENTAQGTDSEDDFKNLFDDVDLGSNKLGSTESKKNELIGDILSLLNGIDFELENTKSDIIGDAYEYLIGEFASGAGKKGGEFYTPAQVSRLLAKIVTSEKKKILSAYDPTCGSGSLLLRLKEYAEVRNYYGQELNPTTYNLARMNMLLHGIPFDDFNIRLGDTLTEDQFDEDFKAEVIVANPPFSLKWKGDDSPTIASDKRFSMYARVAPKSAADYAFVTHMLFHLSDNGVMAVVLPHGALFRGGAEGHIRRYIIENQNFLDAVIGLPANLFYGTSIPACIMVFKKTRGSKDDILLIDASKDFIKEKNQNKLADENLEKIFQTYSERKEVEKYSHKASIEEIKENDFNLNIPRYVDTFEEEEKVDIEVVAKDLKKLKTEQKDLEDKIAEFCKVLGIEMPF